MKAFRWCDVALFVLWLATKANGEVLCKDESETWDGEEVLDEAVNFTVQWRVENEELVVALSAARTGWLGFGIPEQTSGSMIGADVVTARYIVGSSFVSPEATVEDRYVPWAAFPYKPFGGEAEFPSEALVVETSTLAPELDCQQDWSLIRSKSKGQCRLFVIKRALVTQDELNDRPIGLDTPQRIIWAYGFFEEVGYHGSRRGTSSIMFGSQGPTEDPCDDCYIMNLTMTNYQILPQVTTYACQSFSLNITEDEHIVAVEPIIDNRRFVHHILVHSCPNENYIQSHKDPIPCGSTGNEVGQVGGSPLANDCSTLVFGWAVGGGKLSLPKEAGFLAGPNGVNSVVVEVHYDNPLLLQDERDSTSIVFTLTKTLRPYNAGVLIAGDPYLRNLNLPANSSAVHKVAACSSACTTKWEKPVQVFASFLHMHSFGHRMWTNRVNKDRDFVETTNAIDFWNFEFQQLTPINTTIEPGDTLYVHCEYDTSRWPNDVRFGAGSLDEMCMDFMFYYPAQYLSGSSEFGTCGGAWNALDIKNTFNIEDEVALQAITKYPELYHMLGVEICASSQFLVNRNILGMDLPFQSTDPTLKDGEYQRKSSFAQVVAQSCPTPPPTPGPDSNHNSDDSRYDFMISPLSGEDTFKFYWRVMNDTEGTCFVSVQMRAEGDRWLSFGLGDSMVNSKVVIALDSAQSGGFSDVDFGEYRIGTSKTKTSITKSTASGGIHGEVERIFINGARIVRFNISAIDGEPLNIGCNGELSRTDRLIFALGGGATFSQHQVVSKHVIDWKQNKSPGDSTQSCKDETELWTGEKILNEENDFRVQWRVKDDEVVLALSAISDGWFGLGIPEQTSGSMHGADVVTVTFNQGNPVVVDRYVPWAAFPYRPYGEEANFPSADISVQTEPSLFPEIDCQQDWTLVRAEQKGQCQQFIVKRKLKTNDAINDRPLNLGVPQRIIWAYGESKDVGYHGSKRGTSSILLGSDPAEESCADCFKKNLTFAKYNILAQETTYACQSFVLDNSEKAHIIAIEPVIDNIPYVHHILVHSCPNSDYFNNHMEPIPCGTSGNVVGNVGSSPLTSECETLVYAWAVGGGKLTLPREAGFLIGPSGIQRIMVEIHYDNPTKTKGKVDSTTIELTLTKTLRHHNAGVIVAGDPFVRSMAMSSEKSAIHKVAACSSACTSQWEKSIHVFSSFLHMHSFGHRIWTNRVNKDGVFLETTNAIDFWNFEFQQLTQISTTVNPGDSLYVHCEYDTSKWPKAVQFGARSLDEMCMDFLFYYPAQQNLEGKEFGACGGLMNAMALKNAMKIPDQFALAIIKQYPELEHMLAGEICAGSYLTVNRNILGYQIPFQSTDPTLKDGVYQRETSFAQKANQNCASGPTQSPTDPNSNSDDNHYDFMVSPISQDKTFKFYWRVVEDKDQSCILSVRMSVANDKWISFGLGSSMTNSKVVIAMDSSLSDGFSSSNLAEYSIGSSRSLTSIKRSSNPTGLQGDAEFSFEEGIRTVRFNITSIDGSLFNLGCSVGQQRQLSNVANGKSVDSLIFAVGSGQVFEYHALTASLTVDWSNSDPSFETKTNTGQRVHGILMAVSMGLLLPAAVFSGLAKHQNWFHAHRILVSLSLLFFLIGLGLAMSFVDSHFSQPHHVIGLICLILLLVNPIVGYFRPEKSAKTRPKWLAIHRTIAVGAVVLGLVNIYIGASLQKGPNAPFFGDNSVFAAVSFVVAGLILILLGIWRSFSHRPLTMTGTRTKPQEIIVNPSN